MRTHILALPLAAGLLGFAGCDIDDLDIGGSERYTQDFHYSYALQPGGRLSVDNSNGSIEISGWDQDTIDISGTKYARTPELRDAIVHRHAVDFDSDYRREEAIASTGGKHALFNAIQVLVDHGDEVILPVPYWVSFKDIVRYAGGENVLLKTDESQGFRVTAEMVARLITPRTKAIILNSPSNPSGAVMSPEDLTEVVRLAHERGIWVLSDECYVYLN